MSGPQFVEWMAYAQLEPFGEERADFRMARLAALTANIHRDPNKSSPFKEADFMPIFDQEPPSKEEIARNIEAYFSILAASNPAQEDEP